MGKVYSILTRRLVEPDLDELTRDEIWERWQEARKHGEDSAEAQRLDRAWHRARVREREAAIEAEPVDATVSAQVAGGYLNVADQTIRTWIYDGVLTGTKKPRGTRGFSWVVPVVEVRRLRLEQNERIIRERSWMQEPDGRSGELVNVPSKVSPEQAYDEALASSLEFMTRAAAVAMEERRAGKPLDPSGPSKREED